MLIYYEIIVRIVKWVFEWSELKSLFAYFQRVLMYLYGLSVP